jgi:hypothetical protein
MTEMATEKKGHMKVTIELEINEELMDVVKETKAKASSSIPEMMRRGGQGKQ